MVRGRQKQCSHVSDIQIHKYDVVCEEMKKNRAQSTQFSSSGSFMWKSFERPPLKRLPRYGSLGWPEILTHLFDLQILAQKLYGVYCVFGIFIAGRKIFSRQARALSSGDPQPPEQTKTKMAEIFF